MTENSTKTMFGQSPKRYGVTSLAAMCLPASSAAWLASSPNKHAPSDRSGSAHHPSTSTVRSNISVAVSIWFPLGLSIAKKGTWQQLLDGVDQLIQVSFQPEPPC